MAVMKEKDLYKAISRVGETQGKLRDQIQDALVSAMYYVMKDCNAQPLNNLLQAVGNAGNITAISHWATTMGPVYVKDGKLAVSKAAAKEAGVIDEDTFASHEENMRKVVWYDFAKEKNKAENVWDSAKGLDNYLSKLDKVDHALALVIRRAVDEYNGGKARAEMVQA